MSKYRLLDLFCGAGGAAMGYSRAGFEVVGVDIKPQPHYPFEFHQAGALTYPLDGFDAYHASPPCQGYSIMRHLPWLAGKQYPLLIEPVREQLIQTGKPWILENVAGAQKLADMQAGYLCGGMFGLNLYRHRLFQSSFFWMQPGHPNHRQTIVSGGMLKGRARIVVYNRPDGSKSSLCNSTGGHRSNAEFIATCEGMGIDWMDKNEISQAIPPAYTEYIGKYLINYLDSLKITNQNTKEN